AYSATKFGLRGLIEGLSREHADRNLQFQFLSPRATRTAFNTPAVEAMNREMKVAEDDPVDVAAQLVAAIASGRPRMQIGWPEKLFARINGALPGLVDRNLKSQLAIIRRHARR
ncbi:MAG: short chain dehydrogenase, partial [Methylotenera sp.]